MQRWDYEANKRDENARRKCRYGAPVEPARKFVFASALE
jgi:hypothetical protein